MGAISILQPLHHFVTFTKIEKASYHRTAFLHAYVLFNFAMPSLDGKALPLMLDYRMMPSVMILVVPEGKYYLADAGFGVCDQLLLPYQGVCYHLVEWGHANVQYVAFLLI